MFREATSSEAQMTPIFGVLKIGKYAKWRRHKGAKKKINKEKGKSRPHAI